MRYTTEFSKLLWILNARWRLKLVPSSMLAEGLLNERRRGARKSCLLLLLPNNIPFSLTFFLSTPEFMQFESARRVPKANTTSDDERQRNEKWKHNKVFFCKEFFLAQQKPTWKSFKHKIFTLRTFSNALFPLTFHRLFRFFSRAMRRESRESSCVSRHTSDRVWGGNFSFPA